MLESFFNKVARVLSYETKQRFYGNKLEIVARVFIGILQTFFSQSPKVIFWTNCACPLNTLQ